MDHLKLRRASRAISLVLLFGEAASVMAQDVNLGELGTRGFRIHGSAASDRSGIGVSGAGDINGDGLADLVIGAGGADPGGDSHAGESYVVFGKNDNTPIDLDKLGRGGFRINGIEAYDYSGASVSAAGDVNGDGLADLIVGAPGADPSGDNFAGESYVVFGKADTTEIDLASLGVGGFLILGVDENDYSGGTVSGAGDVNGDGLADLIVGARGSDPYGNLEAGKSYVVFGKTDASPIELRNLGAGGFRIFGIDPYDASGSSVSGAGDVNGDGLADLIIGARFASHGGESIAGESYVVFGKTDDAPVDLGNLGAAGFRIDGIDSGDESGFSVSGAGDVNGDGLADLIVGAKGADPGGDSAAGESHVVFGKADNAPVDLGNLGAGGFRIDGIDSGDLSGFSVSGAGDVNGDGLTDLMVGAYRADPGDNSNAGESYVVFGKDDSATVDLANLGSGGFRLDGIEVDDYSGTSVSGAGDVNGDGLADLIIGAFGADPDDNSDAGESYVVFSNSTPLSSTNVLARNGNGNPPRTAIGISGDGSNDSSPDARAWIDFADGSDPLNLASLETMTLNRSAGAFPDSRASVHWQLQTTRQNWTTAELRVRYLDSELTGSEQAMQVYYSPTGNAPFTPQPSITRLANNTIRATITQPGYYFIGSAPDLIFADGFE